MDINYFINILQQNTETIKQLNERIKLLEEINLLEKSEKEDNLTTLIKDVQLMKLKESNKNKQLKEQIELLENENKQLKKEMEKTNENIIKYCDIIKTLEYRTTKQRERICLLENDKSVKTINTDDESLNNVKNKINQVDDDVKKINVVLDKMCTLNAFTMEQVASHYKYVINQGLSIPQYKYDFSLSNTMKIDDLHTSLYLFKYLSSFESYEFRYKNIFDSKICSNTITKLTIYPQRKLLHSRDGIKWLPWRVGNGGDGYPKYGCYALKWTLDGIENIPNLEELSIYNGYGLYGVYKTLSSTPNKLKSISLFACKTLLQNNNNEYNLLQEYCTSNNINFYYNERYFERNKNIPGDCSHVIKYLEYDDELWN